MANAAVTFVYNESVNLPIWAKYCAGQFGTESHLVIDRGSDDGSTEQLPAAVAIRLATLLGLTERERSRAALAFQVERPQETFSGISRADNPNA